MASVLSSPFIPKRPLKASGSAIVNIKTITATTNNTKNTVFKGLPKKFIAAYANAMTSPP